MVTPVRYLPMRYLLYPIVLSALACTDPTTAPTPASATDDNSLPYAQLALPRKPPNITYDISVRLDDRHKQLGGTLRLRMRNTSQRQLNELRFHLYLNAFARDDTLFMRSSGGKHRRNAMDKTQRGWIRIKSAQISETAVSVKKEHDGTVAVLELPSPLPAGQTLAVTMNFQAQLPRVFARTGHAGNLFMVAQWYPKMGFLRHDGSWHCPPFHANSEFFGEFANYRVVVTTAKHFIIGASGQKIAESTDGNSHTQTFVGQRIHDFAWVAWPNFTETRLRLAGVNVRLLSMPGRSLQRQRLRETLRLGLDTLQRWFGAYPYPQLTVVDLPLRARGAAGMEYPQLFTTLLPAWAPNRAHSFDEITVHELVHQYFQGIVATNEVSEPWLDEAVTSYVSGIMLDAMFGKQRSFVDFERYSLGQWHKDAIFQLGAKKLPVGSPAARYKNWHDYAAAVYGRGSALLRTIASLIGQQQLIDTLGRYVHRYAFTHPTGNDLRRMIVDATPAINRTHVKHLLNTVLDRGTPVNVGLTCKKELLVAERRTNVQLPLQIVIANHDGTRRTLMWPAAKKRLSIKQPIVAAQIVLAERLALDITPLDNACVASDTRLPISVAVAGFAQQLLQLVGP